MVRRRPGSAIDNIKGVTSPKNEGRDVADEKKDMSEKERKIMRDAFNLFDTDGDGSVTKDELKVSEELREEDLPVGFTRIISRVSTVGQTKKHKRRERRKKEKSNQHDAMVAHFNLRRLSIDNAEEQGDEMEMAIKAIAEKESRKWKHMLRRPMNPSSTFRRSWELMVLVLVLFQAIYIPLTVSFRINHIRYTSWWWFDLWADIIFMTDLVMTFNVGIINQANKLIMNRRTIAKSYLQGWFWLDLAASVPFDLIIEAFEDEGEEEADGGGNTASATSLLKGFKLPRLLRLLKIMRLMRLVKFAKIRPEIIWWFQYSRHSNLLRLFTLVIGVILVIHYMACFFFPVMQDKWLSRLDCEDLTLGDFEEFIGESDLAEAVAYGDGAPLQSCTGNSTNVATQYATAFYNSMLLIQGEHIDPKSVEEKLYCSFLILMGSLVLALIFGNVSMYIANFSANATAYQRKMEYLFESMNHLELPQNLKKRIIMYYDHIWKEYRSLDGQVYSFIPELSKQLSSEVYLYLRTNLILSVPFLRQCSPEIVQRLVTALCTEVFLPNDYIVHKGVPGEEMYLISRGTCEVTITDFTARTDIEDAQATKKGIKRRGSTGARKKSSFLGMSVPVIKTSPTKDEPRARKNSLSGRRRSSIVGAMALGVEKMQETFARNSDGSDTDKEAMERRRLSKKGILPPERTDTGMLKEAKSFRGVERDDSVRSSAGEQDKRDRSYREQRKHSIDFIPEGVDLMKKIEEHAAQQKKADEKAREEKRNSKASVEGKKKTISFFSSEKGNGGKEDGSVLSDDKSDKSGDEGGTTLRAPSRVGQVEARNIAFPMMKGMSMGNVSVVPVSGRSDSQRESGGGSSDSGSTGREGGVPREGFGSVGKKGGVKIRDLIKTEKVVKELLEGDYFGEIALILNTTRTCNVRAKTFVELNILKRDDFEEVVGKYKEERGLMEEIIMEKYKVEVSNLEKNKRAEKKDIALMVQKGMDSSEETRLMIDTLSQQVALITQSLIMSDVIKLGDGGSSNSSGQPQEALELSRRLSDVMGVSGSNRSLAQTNSGRSLSETPTPGILPGQTSITPPRQHMSREGSLRNPPGLIKLNSIREKRNEESADNDSGRESAGRDSTTANDILKKLYVSTGDGGEKDNERSPGSGETEEMSNSTKSSSIVVQAPTPLVKQDSNLAQFASEHRSSGGAAKTYTEEEYQRRMRMPSEEYEKVVVSPNSGNATISSSRRGRNDTVDTKTMVESGDSGEKGGKEEEESEDFDELVKSIDMGGE
ncbi:hypothetical protein TrLO_g2547 [Triparma laevis f. longispina]|uniref:Calmodulin n=1 Tax=Triparma laevis f. longispina TaxID=1714387 RepID=A0A9W7DL03_9STRA|nr:hypothetical protein TrLO_g2547 [Triparma laevis f. longispina]